VERAPAADPDTFNNAIYCREWESSHPYPPGVTCEQPPVGAACLVGRGAACSSDCDCAFGLRCLGEAGCGDWLIDGQPCPSSCPRTGECTHCSSGQCDDGICRRPNNPSCRGYGQTCHTQFPNCCDGIPCSGGLCRFN
jgi:hypothetical protein